VNRREVLLRSSVAAVGGAAAPIRIDVGQFGASGDGITDDAPAIQAALDHLGEKGGGAALLSCPKVHYRICRGLKLPAYVSLEGPAPVEYPFNAGNKGACALVADFADPLQWMIEPATLSRGREVAYNRLVAAALPDGVTYN
jgi:hypothetical protein